MLEFLLWVALLALVLVALNFGLQRLARPDKGHERIAGCCGMALPGELLRPDPLPGTSDVTTSSDRAENVQVENSGDEYHEL